MYHVEILFPPPSKDLKICCLGTERRQKSRLSQCSLKGTGWGSGLLPRASVEGSGVSQAHMGCCMAGFPCSFVAPRVLVSTVHLVLCTVLLSLRSKSPCQGLGLSSHCCPYLPLRVCGGHIQGLGRPGAPGLVPACLRPRTQGLLRMTVLPRIKNRNKQTIGVQDGSPPQT